MADIMLVLLIIFMITTPLLQNDLSVNLPKAVNPLNAQTESAIVVALTREGRIYYGKVAVSESELRRALSERMAAEVDKSIFLRADEAVAYGRVVDLITECRKLGVEHIGLMAEKPAPSAPR